MRLGLFLASLASWRFAFPPPRTQAHHHEAKCAERTHVPFCLTYAKALQTVPKRPFQLKSDGTKPLAILAVSINHLQTNPPLDPPSVTDHQATAPGRSHEPV